MSDQGRIRSISFGKHSSATDLTSTPGTILRGLFESHDGFVPQERERLERTPTRDDARFHTDIAGKVMLPDLSLEMLFRSMSGNAGDAVTSATASQMGPLMDCMFGDADDVSGTGSTVAGGNGATPNLQVASGTNFAGGDIIFFETSAGKLARQIVSGGGTTTLVLDRVYTGTPVNASQVYRAPRWSIDPNTHEHKHAYFRAQGTRWRRDFFGCMGTAKLLAPVAKPLMLQMQWKPSDVQDVANESFSFSPATFGNAIVNLNSVFMVGDQAYLLRDCEVDFGGEVEAKEAQDAAQGVHGYSVFNKLPKIRGKLYIGSGTTELDDNSSSPLNIGVGQGTNLDPGDDFPTFDCSLQFGNLASSCAYLRAPAAQFSRFKPVIVGGREMIDFELKCVSPASSVTALHIGVF